MKVYIIWFLGVCDDNPELITIFDTEEDAKAYLKEHRTFGNEGLYLEEHGD